MSTKWLKDKNSIFGSFDIRNYFIKNLKELTDIPIDKACVACGVNYSIFYKEYLDKPHPDPNRVAMACEEYQFKNLCYIYGINIKYHVEVRYSTSDALKEELNEFIRKRVKTR